MGARALCAALVVAIVAVALRKIGVLGETVARVILALAAAGVAAAWGVAWSWRLPEQAGARALDRFHGLHDRFASALAFAARPAGERSAFMDAAIEDAVASVAVAQPRAAVPVALPRAVGGAAALAGVLTAVMLFEVRHH
ncbi:MAG TPA: hypothetical protein VF765_14035, partial [Polyangiaceae bacterium]